MTETAPTVLVRCDCKVCGGATTTVRTARKVTPTMAHNLVALSRSPLAGLPRG